MLKIGIGLVLGLLMSMLVTMKSLGYFRDSVIRAINKSEETITQREGAITRLCLSISRTWLYRMLFYTGIIMVILAIGRYLA
jgi:hypothetical protein